MGRQHGKRNWRISLSRMGRRANQSGI